MCVCVQGNLSTCTSELENSYGIGFGAGSMEAKVRIGVTPPVADKHHPSVALTAKCVLFVHGQSFLAGKPTFAVDDMEIWAVGVWDA